MTGAIGAALFTKLSSVTGMSGHVFARSAPTGSTYPYATFGLVSLVDEYVLAGREWLETLWDVTTWDKSTSPAAARTKADLIDAALTDGSMSISGAALLSMRREGRREMDPTLDGIRYQQIVDTYRLRVQPT